VVDLKQTPPAHGLPKTLGHAALALLDPGPMWSVAPFKGRAAAVSKALGADLPKVGRSTSKDGRELLWFSQGQWLMIGAAPDATAANDAAITDQSDAWCALQIKGAGAQDVLARLVPVDLRQSTLKRGHCLRSQLGHMNVHITRTGKDAFRLLGFRSMAHTMVQELSHAMADVAARG